MSNIDLVELTALLRKAGIPPAPQPLTLETGTMLRKLVRHVRGICSAMDEWLDSNKVPKQ
jgi:hypothetical protein